MQAGARKKGVNAAKALRRICIVGERFHGFLRFERTKSSPRPQSLSAGSVSTGNGSSAKAMWLSFG